MWGLSSLRVASWLSMAAEAPEITSTLQAGRVKLGEGQKNPLREVPLSDFCCDTLAVLQLQEDLGSVVL